MEAANLTLVIPERPDIERDALAEVWKRYGGEVVRLGRFWEPPVLDPTSIRVYGNDTFCLVLQQKLGLELCSPSEELLLTLPTKCLRRKIEKRFLAEQDNLKYPVFVKPLVPKQFTARVYTAPSDLGMECRGMSAKTGIIVSEVVRFRAEARAFMLDGSVLDCAQYEGSLDCHDLMSIADEMARDCKLPRAVVMDIGQLNDDKWAVIEFNAAWGAGLNGCNPERIWPCIAAASGPHSNSDCV